MSAALSRRSVLQGAGALVVAFTLAPRALAQATESAAKLPGSLAKAPLLDAWIRIDADGKVTVFTGKAELGQGIRTALLQVAAEELGLEPGAIALVTADTARTPDEGYTAGSKTIQVGGVNVRKAAAEARQALLEMASIRCSSGSTISRTHGRPPCSRPPPGRSAGKRVPRPTAADGAPR